MNTCYIFGSVETNNPNIQFDSSDLVIAADKGLLSTQKFNISPDYIIGDFDSLEYIPTGDNVVIHPKKKDDTDLILAVKTGLNKGFRRFEIYGCLGGERLDHTIATIQTAAFIDENNAIGVLHTNDTSITLLNNNSIYFSGKNEGYVSIFSYSETSVISTEGLLYSVTKKEIKQNYPLGVSNEFKDNTASVTCHSGKAIVTWNNKCNYKIGE